MRVAVDVLGVEPDELEQFLDLRSPVALAARTSGWISNGSPMMSPTVIRGFSEVYGSWMTIWMFRRDRRSSRPGQLGDVRAVERHRARGRPLQADQQSGHGGLAAAGLADDAERLAAARSKETAVDGLDRTDLLLEEDALGQREVLDQVANLKYRLTRGCHRGPPSSSDRRCCVSDRSRGAAAPR